MHMQQFTIRQICYVPVTSALKLSTNTYVSITNTSGYINPFFCIIIPLCICNQFFTETIGLMWVKDSYIPVSDEIERLNFNV